MNDTQRKVLKGMLGGIIISLAFPPFQLGLPNGATAGIGYGFIFSWPEQHGFLGTVNVGLLIAEWIAIIIIGSLLWKIVQDPTELSFSKTLFRSISAYIDAHIEAARIRADGVLRSSEIKTEKEQRH